MLQINKQKKELEGVVKKALIIAAKEITLCGDLFSEEALRYIVLHELSNKRIWGQFPTCESANTDKRLVFEFKYPKFKNKNGNYHPDIVSLNVGKNGKPLDNNPLAIELKVSAWATKDIDKCREYVNPKKGKYSFELSAVIVAPLPSNRSMALKRTNARKKLQEQKKSINERDLKILFAWINPQTKKPELFWIS